jgi:CRP/FNR family transcriptional regulator
MELPMSMHPVPELTTSPKYPAESVALDQLTGLLRMPPPVQARLAGARIGLQRMAPHDVLYRSGDAFESFYVVLSGLLKLAAVDAGGREQVLAFVLSGETAGLDGFQVGNHCSEATALDAVEVALVPLAKLERLAQLAGEREFADQLLHRILTRAMLHDGGALCLLETLDARTRVAALLLSLGKRSGCVGPPSAAVALPMTPTEIGSYLRLATEAVAGVLSEFAAAGLIGFDDGAVSLENLSGLAQVVEQGRQPKPVH